MIYIATHLIHLNPGTLTKNNKNSENIKNNTEIPDTLKHNTEIALLSARLLLSQSFIT